MKGAHESDSAKSRDTIGVMAVCSEQIHFRIKDSFRKTRNTYTHFWKVINFELHGSFGAKILNKVSHFKQGFPF